jgi:hypothetical protein
MMDAPDPPMSRISRERRGGIALVVGVPILTGSRFQPRVVPADQLLATATRTDPEPLR